MACAPFDPAGGYVTGLTGFIDCRVEALGRDGYLALAASGSPVFLALSGLLTILVAMVGYRLLLGGSYEIRDGGLTALRVGIVLALATQWPAYQAVVYNIVIKGPAELQLALAHANDSAPEAVIPRIETSYSSLQALGDFRSLPARPAAIQGKTDEKLAQTEPAPIAGALTIEDRKRVAASSTVFLVSGLAALLSVRIAAGLMLALGPLFIASLLFEGSKGFFEGWIRALAGSALGSVAAHSVLAIELAILEPQIGELLQAVQPSDLRPGAAAEVYVTTLLFAIVAAVTIFAVIRAASGFRLPDLTRSLSTLLDPSTSGAMPSSAPLIGNKAPNAQGGSRAHAVADAVRLSDRRSEERRMQVAGRQLDLPASSASGETANVIPLGRTYRRPRSASGSAAAARRDKK